MSELSYVTVSALKGFTLPHNAQRAYFEKAQKALGHYQNEIQQALDDPMLIDDTLRQLPNFGDYLLFSCETLICLDVDNTVVGFAVFGNVVVGRHAEFIGWVNPDYRSANFRKQKIVKEFLGDMIQYAWDILQVVRIEAKVATSNYPAIRFAWNAGFKTVGNLRFNFQTQGQLFDSVLLELINPKYDIPEIEKTNVRKQRRRQLQTISTDSESSDGVVEPAQSGTVRTSAAAPDKRANVSRPNRRTRSSGGQKASG